MGNKELNKKAIKELDKIYLNKIGADKKFRKKVINKLNTFGIPGTEAPCNRLTRTGFKSFPHDIFERLGIDFGHGVVPFQYSYNILKGKINLKDDNHISYEKHCGIMANYQIKIRNFSDLQSIISISDNIHDRSYINILRFISTSILDGVTNIKLRMRDIKVDTHTAAMIDLLRWDLFHIYFLYADGWFDVEELENYTTPIMNRLTLLGIFFTDYMPYEKFARYVPGCAGIRAFNIKNPVSPICLEVTNSGESYSYQRGYIGKASVDDISEKVSDKIEDCRCVSYPHSSTDARMSDMIRDVNKMNQTMPDLLLPQMYCLGLTQVSINDDGEYSFFNDCDYSYTIRWLHDIVYNMITAIIDNKSVSTKSIDVANAATILSI